MYPFKLRFQPLVAVMLVSFLSLARVSTAEEWNGFEKRPFEIDGHKGFVIVPQTVTATRPWIWRTEFFGHEPQADLALLGYGFHVAYVDVQNLYGSPAAIKIMDAMYSRVTSEFGLSPKVVLEGFSRGGLFTLNWAAENPDKVACIYNDAPVCDFKSWPGGKGKSKGSPADWERLKSVFGFQNDEEALAYKRNPVDNLKPLARSKIPLLHVCGETDDVVPIDENTRIVEQRYKQLGGPILVIAKPNCNHHPHSLQDPTRIVNFVLSHTGFADKLQAPLTPYGYDYFAVRKGLPNCRLKFERNKKGRVAFLGGSITASPGWRDEVCQDLKRRFPDTDFDFVNAGIPSLGSTPGAFRFSRDVLARGPVDLLFEEAAVNDDTNGFSDIEQIRGMEGIVRQAMLSNPKMDIILLHFVDPGKIVEINRGQSPSVIVNHERVAECYGLPSINLAREVAERIHAGEFTWEKDFIDLHPSPFGHHLYAKSIHRLFDVAWKDTSPRSTESTHVDLPEPVDRFSYFRGRLINPTEAAEAGMLSMQKGWRIDPSWNPTDRAGTRPGFVRVPTLIGDEVGSTAKFQFQGSAVGLFVASGPDTGTVEFRIDGGDWRMQELFTRWSPNLHLPWAKILAGDLANADHILEFRIADAADERSRGHAIRIMFLLVN